MTKQELEAKVLAMEKDLKATKKRAAEAEAGVAELKLQEILNWRIPVPDWDRR